MLKVLICPMTVKSPVFIAPLKPFKRKFLLDYYLKDYFILKISNNLFRLSVVIKHLLSNIVTPILYTVYSKENYLYMTYFKMCM